MKPVTRFIAAAILAGAWSSRGGELEPRSPTAPVPRIQFASTEYDFGKVEAGVLVKHDFAFTNIGSTTLQILDVRPGCGCTTAGKWDRKVKPGRTGLIPLQFNSANFGGPVAKQAIVLCDDPGQSNVVLEIRGTVWKPIELSSSLVVFNLSSESDPTETKTVRIVSNLDAPLYLTDLQCTNRSFHVNLVTVKEGKEFELQIVAAPPFESTTIGTAISMKTSWQKLPRLELPAYVLIQEPVTVVPPQIMLFPGSFSNTVHAVVSVRYTGTNVFALSEASVNVPGVKVGTEQTDPGHSFNLTVDFPIGFQIEPGRKVEVAIKSNHPKFPMITVPVIQLQMPETQTATTAPDTRPPNGRQKAARDLKSRSP